MKRASRNFLAIFMVLAMVSEALAVVPAHPLAMQPLASPGLLSLANPESLLWTPLALVKVGRSAEVADLIRLDPTYGASYVLTAPSDGVVEYLYPWTGFFEIGQPLIRLYDPAILKDLQQAKAAAGQFNPLPFLTIALPPGRQAFPSPTVAARAVRVPVTLAPEAPAIPEAPQIGLQRAAPRAEMQVVQLQKALERAQQDLAAIEEELSARQQLNDSGVLDPEEVARFAEERTKAQAAVRSAQRELQAAERQGEAESATSSGRSAAPSRGSRPGATTLLLPAIPPPPLQLQRLTAPRWTDIFAPTSGLAVQPLQTPGTLVKAGTPLLRVSNSAWSHVKALTTRETAAEMESGMPVAVSFPELGGLGFAGWVVGKHNLPGDERTEVEFLLTRPDDGLEAEPLLFNLGYGSPPAKQLADVELVPSAQRIRRTADLPERLLGLIPVSVADNATRNQLLDASAPLAGRLALMPSTPHFGPAACTDPQLQQRLAQLHNWQTTFIQGMTTAIYDQKITLSYPREGEISQAVERMVRGEVGHDSGYCARTLREALGWGLGDAYQWAIQLPQRGYVAREDGLPRPGDILVWPFTYGVNHSQHIGVAVLQNQRLVLLSNLSGRLGTSEILGGYVAFYQPTPANAQPGNANMTPVPPLTTAKPTR